MTSTWKFANNDNPILQAVTFSVLPVSAGGLGLDFEETWLPVLDEIADQADICDEPVALKGGGFLPRYRGGGTYKFSDPPGDVLQAMLGPADGFLCERGDGALTIRAGKFQEEDCDILFTDKHIISLRVRRWRPDEDDITGCIVKYTSPPHEYTEIDAPVWPRDATPDSGNDRRIRSVPVIWCQEGRQAQRLSKRVAIYEMATITGSMVVTMFGVTILDRRFARIQTSDDPELQTEDGTGVVAKVNGIRFDLLHGTHEIDFTVIDPVALDEWDETTEEGPLQPVLFEPIGDGPVAPADVIAIAEIVGGNTRVILEFEDPLPDSSSRSFQVRYRQHDVGNWSATLNYSGSAIEVNDDDIVFLTVNSVASDAVLDFEVRTMTGRGPSDWSTPDATVDTGNPSPGRPTAFTATLNVADVDLAWTAPDSSSMDHARVFRAIHDGGFGLAVDISGPLPGAANDPMTYTDTAPGSGDYDYWVRAENAGGAASAPVGPENVTVP